MFTSCLSCPPFLLSTIARGFTDLRRRRNALYNCTGGPEVASVKSPETVSGNDLEYEAKTVSSRSGRTGLRLCRRSVSYPSDGDGPEVGMMMSSETTSGCERKPDVEMASGSSGLSSSSM